ncbi:hypothetical protein [Bacillus aerolatus]|uniref:hypothetical protein n=1 Tax=Bacillus aerolatus TaxID=2653354 RepID=UPI001780236E|nr:hypothetical protein [Bacillus aerolatus]
MKMEMGNFIGGINIPLEEYVQDGFYTIHETVDLSTMYKNYIIKNTKSERLVYT